MLFQSRFQRWELLTQLAILTNLSAEELDEFQADIAKMKMSEQAAFVKEVIMQEAIRAARRDGRTVEETIAAVEHEAMRRLGGEEEEVEPIDVVDTGPVETVFLEEEKKTAGGRTARSKVLLATVKGDVHDIGKNIVGVEWSRAFRIFAINSGRSGSLGFRCECLSAAHHW